MRCHVKERRLVASRQGRLRFTGDRMRAIVTLPGIYGSDADHWQSVWEAADPRLSRFQPGSWDLPDLADWIEALNRAVQGAATPPILVAHSLACLLVAHWASRRHSPIAGAFLVSVPDPEGPNFPSDAASFAAVPTDPLPFPSLVVASTDDPYGSLDYMRSRAIAWGSGLVVAGAFGHISSSSGLGDWPQGRDLVAAFQAGLGAAGSDLRAA